ncbi:hypothetical protein [Agromyces bracchium]|uniref:Lipoprotein n=1 Tax=Agromyces bracchium TaxID=88376 RepID=A0A6I3M5G9_9MICO|nr:hypothetical protein [Agromyces bracchium]MTH67377.1 hypothetical protein [Agromyces bracchium]
MKFVSVAIVVVLALALGGCATEALPDGSVAVRAGQTASVASPDGGVTVTLPAGSFTGDGTLSANPVRAADGSIESWTIELSGSAVLTGEAELRFVRDGRRPEAPAPLVTSTDGVDEVVIAEDVVMDGDAAVVMTSHFSNWFVLWWEDVADSMRAGLDDIYSDAGRQPSCDAESEVRDAGFAVESDAGSRVYWCFGMGSSGAMLDAVNGRGYTVAAESTPGMEFRDGGTGSLVDLLADLIKETPSKSGNTVELIGPGGHAVYDVTAERVSAVRLTPSVGGYLVTAAQYAVETVAMILPLTGKHGVTTEAIQKFFDWGGCLSGFTSMATASIETATQASTYFSDAVGVTLDCAEDALERAGLTALGTQIASGLSWLASGVRTALNGFGAAADLALDPTGYTITVTPPGGGAWLITGGAIGPYRAGMSLEEASAEFGTSLGSPPVSGEFVCQGVDVLEFGDGTGVTFSYRFWDGEYWSIVSLKSPPDSVGEAAAIRTAEDIGLGSSEAAVQEAYGGLVTPMQPIYAEGDFYYRVSLPDGDIILYGTEAAGVTGLNVSTTEGPPLDHFCS